MSKLWVAQLGGVNPFSVIRFKPWAVLPDATLVLEAYDDPSETAVLLPDARLVAIGVYSDAAAATVLPLGAKLSTVEVVINSRGATVAVVAALDSTTSLMPADPANVPLPTVDEDEPF